MTGFAERLAALAGRGSYREPVGGRATGGVMTDQDVAAAVAMGRRRRPDGQPDHKDIGPDILFAMYTQTRHRKPDIVDAVADALLSHPGLRGHNRWMVRKATNAAFEQLAMHYPIDHPASISPSRWALYFSAAWGVMQSEAGSALIRAEAAFRLEKRRVQASR